MHTAQVPIKKEGILNQSVDTFHACFLRSEERALYYKLTVSLFS